MGARATVYDVARVAGVSIKTVSRVVNGSEQVTEQTRLRVMAAVADLDYVRNSAARSLRTGTTDTIGVIVDSLADPFFATLVSVLEERALEHGFSVLVASTGRSVDRERDQISRLAQQNIRGLLLAPNGTDHDYLTEPTFGVPIVLMDRSWELAGFDSVRVEDYDGARLAVDHLLAHGHRRIAFIGDDVTLPTVRGRHDGYLSALRAAEVPVEPRLIRFDAGERESAARATSELLALDDPPTAIFSSNPRASQGVVQTLHREGRTEIAMVGFGDFALADALQPGVTIIDQDPAAIAAAAADLMLARIAGTAGDPSHIVLPLHLVARGSGELTA